MRTIVVAGGGDPGLNAAGYSMNFCNISVWEGGTGRAGGRFEYYLLHSLTGEAHIELTMHKGVFHVPVRRHVSMKMSPLRWRGVGVGRSNKGPPLKAKAFFPLPRGDFQRRGE